MTNDPNESYSDRTTWGYHVAFKTLRPGLVQGACASIPELAVSARDTASAQRASIDALDAAIQKRMSDGENIPPFDPVGTGGNGAFFATLRAIHVLKVQLHLAMLRKGWTRAGLMRELGWHRNQVDRLFDLEHASRVGQIDAAARALGWDPDWRMVVYLDGPVTQVTHDGDGWRIRLVTDGPEYAGDPLTPTAFETEAQARAIAAVIEEALLRTGRMPRT